jgi:hypothetical protein
VKETLTLLLLGALLGGLDASAGQEVRITMADGPINVFSGAATNVTMAIVGQRALHGRVVWRLAANSRTLDRGESGVTFAEGETGVISILLRVPEVRPGVVFQAELTVEVLEGAEEALARADVPVYVFAEDAFEGRRDWIRELPLSLFDPAGDTAKILEAADVPFVRLDNVDALPEQAKGVLVVGEGVSLREYRGLWAMLIAAAEKGVPVLCLAPSEGEVDLSGPLAAGGQRRVAARIEFRGADVVRDLDKRLAASACMGRDVATGKSLMPRGERGPVWIEVGPGTEGWQWIELGLRKSHSRIVLCGFPLIANWGQNPAPRYLLCRTLEYVTSGSEARKHSRNETEEGGGRR